MSPPPRRRRRGNTNCDITFGTNNEFGFDYLRDNMSVSPEDLVQRKHHYAIVDEVDSVLIDDARTPLIISGPIQHNDADEAQYLEFRPYVEKLYQAQRSLVNQTLKRRQEEDFRGATRTRAPCFCCARTRDCPNTPR